jgi:hypothetical protein
MELATMIRSGKRFVRCAASLTALVVLGWILTGHAAGPDSQGMPTDWSHRHLIFSRPAASEQAARVEGDPRYWQQWARRNIVSVLDADDLGSGILSIGLGYRHFGKVQRDWSQNLGSGGTVGAGNYPAKYSFQITTAKCANATQPDYVIFNTGLTGSASQANIVAYDNLYSGCSGTVPGVYWAYDTGGKVVTSPAISGDGMQAAFVQTSGAAATLVLLKWKAANGTVGAPVVLTAVSNASYRTCTVPCMTTIALKDNVGVATDDTTSSPFADYTHDTIWVGGTRGWLHKITGAFRGTPAEATTGGFPASLNAGSNSLSSPISDFASGIVFVGDLGGFFYRVSSTGAVTASGRVDHGTGLVAAPIVDSSAGKIYVFSSNDGSASCPGAKPCSAVYEFTTSFGSGTTGAKATVGASATIPKPLYEGAADSTYEASVNATGNLYVCGNTGGVPTLYQIPVAAGTMGTVVTGPTLTSAATGCSPVSDISNPNAAGGVNEWIFAGVQANGSGNSCGGAGCAMNFTVQPWQPSTVYVAGQEVLDTHFQVQVVRTGGTSRTAAQGHPNWSTTLDAATNDNTVQWRNQGPHLAAHAVWQSSHAYAGNAEILDSNGNVEIVTTAGISRTAAQGHPTWSVTVQGQTADNTVRWRNVGPIATFSLAAAGGPSGIIMDNTVATGTLAGASKVYYSTQSNQTCGTAGTGGCAVQASQAALQ